MTKEPSNQEIIETVARWQAAPGLDRLTCSVDKTHGPLQPIERASRVVAACTTCGTARPIPDSILRAKPMLDAMDARRIAAEADPFRRRTDLIWSYASAGAGGGLLGLALFNDIGAAVGFVSGLLLAYLGSRRR